MIHHPETAGASELQASQIAIAELGDVVLQAAWPEGVREARQLAFDRAVERVRTSAFNTDEQDVVDFSAPHWRWRLFGIPNDSLPDNLQYVSFDSWDPQVKPFTSSTGVNARCYASGMAATHLAPLLRERAGNIQQHRPEIEAKAEPVVVAMPIYQLLRSFVPDKTGGTQPLTYGERLGREQEIYDRCIYEASINGMQIDRKDLETRPGYDLVRRPMAALDYEDSIYPRKDASGDPWEKVRQLVLKQLTYRYRPEKRERYSVRWDNENFYISVTADDGTEYNTNTSIRWTAREIVEHFHRGAPKNELCTPGKECEALLARAFTAPPAEEYEPALAKTMAVSKEGLVARVAPQDMTLAGWRMGINNTGSFTEDQIHAQLSRSTGSVVSFESFEPWADKHAPEWRRLREPPARDGVQFISEHEAYWARQTEAGRVRGTLDRDRLVSMGGPLPAGIAQAPVPGHAVELVFPASQFGDHQPLLVGHNLIAAYKRGATNYYQYERAAYDPMALQGETRTPLPEATRLRVAAMCETIGLTQMAADIRNQRNCSVVDLERLLTRYSKYVYDNPAGELEGPVPFEELSQYVVNGRYHCQCTGAGYLFGHLLRAVYADDPSIEVRTVGGLVAKRTVFGCGDINSTLHAENHTYKNGELAFVLDATPPAPLLGYGGTRQSLLNEDPYAPIEPIKPRQKEYERFMPSLQDMMPPRPMKAFEALSEQLHEILQLQYGVHDKAALYEKLVRLPRQDDDPTIRTIRLFHQGEDSIQPAHVQEVLGYLRSIRAFPAGERSGIGFGRYTDGILDVLISTLVELHQLQISGPQ